MQENRYSKVVWNEFLSKIRSVSPISSEEINKFIKFKQSTFPTDSDMIEHYESVFSKITSASNRKKWHEKDKCLLIWCVAKTLKLREKTQLIPENQDWEYLSQILNVNQQLLENKWLQFLHSNLIIKKWTQEEDQLLIKVCNDILKSNNWTKVALKFNSLSKTQRYPKQIRERYCNVLNPILRKSDWSERENQLLINLVKKYGKKWSKICAHFEGRSENQLRLKFNLFLKSQQNQEQFLLSNDCQKIFDAQENNQQHVLQQDLLNQQQGEESQQEQIQIQQHQQQPQNQYFQEKQYFQPVYHNYYNYHLYPQIIQRQQIYSNHDPRLCSFNYPYYNPPENNYLNYYQQ